MIKRFNPGIYVSRVAAFFLSAISAPITLLITVASLIVATNTLARESGVPEFSAYIEQRFAPTEKLLNRVKVFVSEQGYRVEQLAGHTDYVLVANIANSSLWFLDTRRMLAHKVPLVEVGAALESPAAQEALVQLPGFINSIPCLDLNGKLSGNVQHNGKTLELWLCNPDTSRRVTADDPGELPVKQYYSHRLKLVLYSRSTNGTETEVVDIVESPVAKQLMSPPAHFKSVPFEEFMGLKPLLSQYDAGS